MNDKTNEKLPKDEGKKKKKKKNTENKIRKTENNWIQISFESFVWLLLTKAPYN